MRSLSAAHITHPPRGGVYHDAHQRKQAGAAASEDTGAALPGKKGKSAGDLLQCVQGGDRAELQDYWESIPTHNDMVHVCVVDALLCCVLCLSVGGSGQLLDQTLHPETKP